MDTTRPDTLPRPLHDWFLERMEEMEASNLGWKHAWKDQVMFVRDEINQQLFPSYEDCKNNPAQIVATHNSKSCELPVYYLANEDVEIWMRGNFYNWKISVRSKLPVSDTFFNLINRDDVESYHYFEGFEKEWIFGPYNENAREFSVSVPYPRHYAFTFIFLVVQSLRAVRESLQEMGYTPDQIPKNPIHH